jgi:hypothetical protein
MASFIEYLGEIADLEVERYPEEYLSCFRHTETRSNSFNCCLLMHPSNTREREGIGQEIKFLGQALGIRNTGNRHGGFEIATSRSIRLLTGKA